MGDIRKGLSHWRGRHTEKKKTKVGMRTKTKTPWRTHAWNEKQTSGHFGKKTKVGMGTKTKTPGERMHEMKTKPKQYL
jgi:hypothetical protein